MASSGGLLTRDEFRESTFARDGGRCVICGVPAVDAHHIVERRLFSDGGYYRDNGASVCAIHHIEAEQTTLSCPALREAAGITRVVIPSHLYPDQPIDKWANPILPSGRRLRGELFDDKSVQSILRQGGVLGLFDSYVKYPRTWHLPWSPGFTSDDRVLRDTSALDGRDVVVTVKLDGENTTLYRDYLHARSIDYEPHPARDRVKALWAQVCSDIPPGWRVCGENLYAKHAIWYRRLTAYFQLFSVWTSRNVCLDWTATEEWAALLGLAVVPVLYRGIYDDRHVQRLWADLESGRDGDDVEGLVVRRADSFHYREFPSSIAKVVRANHVPDHGNSNWRRGIITRNEIAAAVDQMGQLR